MRSAKERSRGASADMSPAAIARRFDILVDLEKTARALESARRLARADRRHPGSAGGRSKGTDR